MVDLSNRGAPALVTTVLPAVGATDVTDVATQNIAGTDYLFVSNYAGVVDPAYGRFTGVYVYSLASPAAPTLVSVLSYGAGPGFHFGSQVRTLTAAEIGGRVFLFVGSVMTGGIVVFEYTNPAAPQFFTSIIRNNVSSSASICDIAMRNGKLYAAWRVGFAVYDLSTLTSFTPNDYAPPQPRPTLTVPGFGAMTWMPGNARYEHTAPAPPRPGPSPSPRRMAPSERPPSSRRPDPAAEGFSHGASGPHPLRMAFLRDGHVEIHLDEHDRRWLLFNDSVPQGARGLPRRESARPS